MGGGGGIIKIYYRWSLLGGFPGVKGGMSKFSAGGRTRACFLFLSSLPHWFSRGMCFGKLMVSALLIELAVKHLY